MPRNVTLSTFRTDLRFETGFDNSRVFSDTRLNAYVNDAIADVWDMLLDARPDYYVAEHSVVTVIGTSTVALASDHYRIRAVRVLIGGYPFPVHPVNLTEAWRFERGVASARNWRYRQQGSSLRIVPTPAEVATLRVYYLPYAPTLSADGDTWDGISGYERLVVLLAKRGMFARERMPTGDLDREIDEETKKIRAAAGDLDAGQAFYLDGQGGMENERPWPEDEP